MDVTFRRAVEAVIRRWLGVWENWTPIVEQPTAVTATIVEAKYCLVGQICHIYASLLVTGAGTGNNPIIVAGLPVDAQIGCVQELCIGSAEIKDAGNLYYHAAVMVHAAEAVKFLDSGQADYVGVAPNYALANNDVISFSATYRIA